MTTLLVTEFQRRFGLAYAPNALEGTRDEFGLTTVTDEVLLELRELVCTTNKVRVPLQPNLEEGKCHGIGGEVAPTRDSSVQLRCLGLGDFLD